MGMMKLGLLSVSEVYRTKWGSKLRVLAKADLFNVHFGPAPPILDLESELGSDGNVWSTEKKGLRGFGRCLEMRPGKGKALEQDEEIKSRVSRWLHIYRTLTDGIDHAELDIVSQAS